MPSDTSDIDPATFGVAHCASDELVRARMHFEDLEIFVGQRSRMHPGPGWATVLSMLRSDRSVIEAELTARGIGSNALGLVREG